MTGKNKDTELAKSNEVEIEPQLEASIPIMDLLKDTDAMNALDKLICSIMDRSRKNATGERVLQGLGVILLVATVLILSYVEKMTPSAGVIFGALAGYIFGKGLE